MQNGLTSGAAKKIIDRGWASSGIEDAINMGLNSLPSIDPFGDIAPMMVELNESSPPFHNHAMCDLSMSSNRSATQVKMYQTRKKKFEAQQMIEIFLTLSTSSMMKIKIYSC